MPWLRSLASAVAPEWVKRPYRRARLLSTASRLSRRAGDTRDPTRLWNIVASEPLFTPLQFSSEIVGLLERIGASDLPPRAVCEIGIAQGGTSFLLTRSAAPDAIMVLVDLAFPGGRDQALRRFGRERQQISCIAGDSTAPQTLGAVRDALGGRPLDLLLIDGDHRYRGVTADFDTYTPLLRPGGLIVLHDIVPDRALRDGAEEGEFVGGVPRFWQVLKDRFPDTEEIIADPEQLGAGFGLVKWPGDRLTR